MTRQELDSIKATAVLLHEAEDRFSISEEDEDVVLEMLEQLISKYNWRVMAMDSEPFHYVETSGYYELKFELITELGEVYINTVDGDEYLQNKWSDDNPQETNIRECCFSDKFDYEFFLEEIVKKFENQTIEEIEKQNQ